MPHSAMSASSVLMRCVAWDLDLAVGNTATEAGAETFYITGLSSRTSATGTAWERTPWHATQRAAWEALKKSET